jgi:hypothetical protein
VRLHTSQVLLPAKVLAVDLAKVSDEEGVLIAYIARVMIDSLNTACQGGFDQLLGFPGAMVFNTTQCLVAERL